jgi:phosphatidylserine decarboxylase
METVHCGEINPPPRSRKQPVVIDRGRDRVFAKGEELGRFNMGSTVVLLFERNRIEWASGFQAEVRVKLGQAIARAGAV